MNPHFFIVKNLIFRLFLVGVIVSYFAENCAYAGPNYYYYYVSIHGSDGNAGTSSDKPFRTIQHAINTALPQTFCTITVAPGRYRECLFINNNKQITLIGKPENPSSVIIDGEGKGSVITTRDVWWNPNFIKGVTITGGNASRGGAIFLYNCWGVFLKDVIITGNKANQGAAVATDTDCGFGMENTLVYGNTSLNNHSIFWFYKNYYGARFINVTIADNKGANTVVHFSTCWNPYFESSIIWNPLIPNFITEDQFEPIRIYNCDILNLNNIPTYVKDDTFCSDPLFVNPEKGKYQLLDNSPCIDAGYLRFEAPRDQNLPPGRGSFATDMGAYGGNISTKIDQLAQIQYTYDNSGNQIERKKMSIRRTSSGNNEISFAVKTIENEYETNEFLQDSEKYEVIIYPNPTKGILKIDISGSEILHNAKAYLYNSSGMLLKVVSPISESNEINLSGYAAGTYLLKIISGEKSSTWKIIKE